MLMRIVHIVNHFMPELGYTEYYLARKQREMGHEVYVVTSDRLISVSRNIAYEKVGVCDEEGVKVIRLRSFLEVSGNSLVPINSLKNVLINLSPHIIHVHGALSPMALAPILYKRIIGCKIVADVITGEVLAKGLSLAVKTTILKAYRSTFLSMFFRKIDCFFANSEAAMEWINENLHVSNSRIRLIPLGADSELFRFEARERKRIRKLLGMSDQHIIAIYTGKLLPHKKIDRLLFAAAPIFKNHENFKILIVGSGPSRYLNYIKKLASELDINSNVIFHNEVHRTELPSFYSAADFAVWPGHHSISIIEAMSTGLPIIIPNSKWTNYLLKNKNGLSYPEGDTAELRRRICALLNSMKSRREMGRRSRELVENELNWTTIAEEYLKVYNSIIDERCQL